MVRLSKHVVQRVGCGGAAAALLFFPRLAQRSKRGKRITTCARKVMHHCTELTRCDCLCRRLPVGSAVAAPAFNLLLNLFVVLVIIIPLHVHIVTSTSCSAFHAATHAPR